MATFTLEFYFDGSKSKQVKSATLSSREDKRQELWLNLYKLCTSTSPRYRAKPINVDDLPTAALVIETLRCIVSEFDDITVNECEYEADQEIALACKRNNDSGTGIKAYCYGNDTDFIAMADCPYIQFGSLEERNGQIRSNMVYYRSNVAAVLDLTEDQFVEFCIVIGNDFTAVSTRSEFDAFIVDVNVNNGIDEDDDDDFDIEEAPLAAGGGIDALTSRVISSIENIHIGQVSSAIQSILPDGSTSAVINKIRKLLICKFLTEPNWKVSSSKSEDLQSGIMYSRAMYRLESLSEFPDEEDDDKNDNDDEEEDDTNGVQLTCRQDCDASNWLKDNCQNFQGVHKNVIEYLAERSSLYSFKSIYIKAFELMHEKLVNGSELPDYEAFLPQYVDVVVANTYQLLCKKFIRFILRSESLSLGINDTPAFLFDGYMFHCIISELEMSGEYNESNLVELPPIQAQEPIAATVVVGGRVVLPIDQHKDTILNNVADNRVVIIHGETGCGKSSRLPLFLLENAEETGQRCKIMISQPRRIAVHALMTQMKKTLGNRVGMRMGGGVREGDDDAKLTFVTTGYLVRFVAYHPEAFDDYTHLIIDEVHERSVDSDLLCYLSRKLLSTNSKLKLILMSATVHTTLYKDYFSGYGREGDIPFLSVGKRRFENAINYVDDLVHNTCSGEVNLPKILLTKAKKILNYDPKKTDPKDPKNAKELEEVIQAQYILAKELIRCNAKRGTAVLVFVAGMKDIDEFLETFEEDEDYKIIAIHSDIPFEEQGQALVAAKPNEIKVIVATNAAESSLTLPDVDIVICLGQQKSIEYDASTHSVQLIKKWVSKSAAIQRAGRTGNIILNIITTIIVIITIIIKAVFDLVQSFAFTQRLYTKAWKIMSSLR